MNNDKTPSDAILNPLNELIDEKESEILELKNGFLDDDAIAENVIISERIDDDLQQHQFQLLYIVDEFYYLIHYAENGKINIVNNYTADSKPSELTSDKTLHKFIESDVDKIVNQHSASESTKIIITDM